MILNVYNHLKYRAALEEMIEIRRNSPTRLTLRRLAEQVGLQPSFLTNVLKERFDFSSDQLFAVATELGFSQVERKYLSLLLEHERSTFKPRRDELLKEIEAIRNEQQKTEKHLSSKKVEMTPDAQAEYYLDPFVQLAHVHLSLPLYDKQPDRMAQVLGISNEHLAKVLEVLIRIGYVERKGTHYVVVGRNRHLPKDNPLCGPHQALMRLKSIDQMQRLSSEQAYSFSATITGNEETWEQLRDAYLTFVKKAEGIVKPAPSKKAYQMNFDLFPWQIG